MRARALHILAWERSYGVRPVLLGVFLWGLVAQIGLASLSVEVESRQFGIETGTRMTVSLTGSSVGEPLLPEVEGLRFVPAGQSHQMRSVNGIVSTTQEFSYVVLAERPGVYRVPAIRARIEESLVSSASFTLEAVWGASSPRSASALRSGRQGVPPGSRRKGGEGELAFLRIEPSKTTSYVGELVPVRIRAYVREGLQASLTSLPQLESDAFVLHGETGEPQRTRERVGQQIYTVLTWYQGMSASKDGEFQVGAAFDANLLVPKRSGTKRRRSGLGGGVFGDSFFDDFLSDDLLAGLFGEVEKRQVTVASPSKTVRVLPLPQSGRPEGFEGAVGRFDLTVEATPRELTAGDPLTLRVLLKGYGNFDRVGEPRLANEEGWKIYSPDSRFEAGDAIGFEGHKLFEQALIPLEDSIEAIPAVEFSYFDPEKKRYEILRSKSIPIEIVESGFEMDASAVGRSGWDRKVADGELGMETESEDLAGALYFELGRTRSSLRPLIEQTTFLAMVGATVLVLLAGVFVGWRRQRREDRPDLRRRRQAKNAVERSLASLDRALRAVDATSFFDACRKAIQERLGGLWAVEPRAITLADLRRRLPQAVGLAEVFELADAAAYSGRRYSQDELRAIRDRLKTGLATWGA